MPNGFQFERRVEFCETDAAGIAHFSSLIVYMEQAEHALLRSVGLSVAAAYTSSVRPDDNPILSWPRVKVECDFQSPARFEDLVTVWTSIEKVGTKSLTFQHRLQANGTQIAVGKMMSVCCSHLNGKLVGIPIPNYVRDLLKPFVI